MLAHIMCSLKLGKVACTQELLFLISSPKTYCPLRLTRTMFLSPNSELYCDRFWIRIRTAAYYDNLYLYVQKSYTWVCSAILSITITQNVS